jgi:MFS transporter, ACS family, D-galactonate transporter
VAYTPWMASFTETVEARNPALTATGLAIWGWIIRVVVFVSFLIIPAVVNSVTPLVNYGGTVATYATTYKSQLAFAQEHADVVATAQKIPPNVIAAAQRIPPDVIAIAQKDSVQLANAQKFQPELAVIQANPTLFAKLATFKDPSKIPPALTAQAVKAAGGGAKGLKILTTIGANKAAISGVIAVAPDLQKVAPHAADLKTIAPYSQQLTTIAPFSKQLTALSKVPPAAFAYLKAHGAAVQKAAAQSPGQWKTWYWICFGGIIFFLLSIPLLRGRWKPSDARADEAAHEAMVAAELAKLNA